MALTEMTEIPIGELRDLRRFKEEFDGFLKSDRQIALSYCHWKLWRLLEIADSPSAGPSGPHLVQQIRELQEMIPKP